MVENRFWDACTHWFNEIHKKKSAPLLPWRAVPSCKQLENQLKYVEQPLYDIGQQAMKNYVISERRKTSRASPQSILCLEAVSRFQPTQSPEFPWIRKTEIKSLGRWNLGGKAPKRRELNDLQRHPLKSLSEYWSIHGRGKNPWGRTILRANRAGNNWIPTSWREETSWNREKWVKS